MAGRSWEVTGLATSQTKIVANGNVVEGTITYFITGHGVEASVFTADTELTEAKVREQVDAQAAKLDAIRNLKLDAAEIP